MSNAAANDVPVIEIAAPKGLVPINLHELWEYRELIFFLFWRDVKGRYRQMALGPLWVIINPVLNMILFTVVFGMVAKLPSDGIPYPVFNYTALLPWTFFTATLYTASGSLLGYRDLIAKVYFPRLTIPLVGVLSALFDFLISFIILIGMVLWYGFVPGWSVLMLPVYLLLSAMTGLAVGLWAASWVVHYRDINTVIGYVVRVWMYVTPVVYATSFVPEKWQWIYQLNPMTVVIDGFRSAMLGTGGIQWVQLGIAFALVLPVLISGAYYFRKTERSIVDIV